MDVTSDFLRLRVDLTHEEAESVERWIHARKFGGAMNSTDEVIINRLLANLVSHNQRIAQRVAEIIKPATSKTERDDLSSRNDLMLQADIEALSHNVYSVMRD